jgi:hypothetical protein
VVAREGSAPSTSGCRPDVMLFHHQAETGCLAWIRAKTVGVKARYAACYTTRQGMAEPEVVATSPNRIKSPVPVYCGFDSRKLVLAAGFAPALATLSTSCLCWLDYASDEMGPPAGVAPARYPYKGYLQAAAGRQEWSQPPVLPWARRAYETCLSAGSTAVLADGDHGARPPMWTTKKDGAPTWNCTKLVRLPSECIPDNALGAWRVASLTGFAPVVSCMRGRRVDWTTPQGQPGRAGRFALPT